MSYRLTMPFDMGRSEEEALLLLYATLVIFSIIFWTMGIFAIRFALRDTVVHLLPKQHASGQHKEEEEEEEQDHLPYFKPLATTRGNYTETSTWIGPPYRDFESYVLRYDGKSTGCGDDDDDDTTPPGDDDDDNTGKKKWKSKKNNNRGRKNHNNNNNNNNNNRHRHHGSGNNADPPDDDDSHDTARAARRRAAAHHTHTDQGSSAADGDSIYSAEDEDEGEDVQYGKRGGRKAGDVKA
ncbi:MAG: hypothetical protein Q9186_004525 [Xanthomendoza sp. 1 TL-2023]